MPSLSERIRQARSEKNLTVRDFAARCGLSAGYISRIEGRGEIPTAEVLCRMSAVLHVPAEELLALAKVDLLEKTAQEIADKQAEALRLYRKRQR